MRGSTKFLIAAFILFCFTNVYGDFSGFTPAQGGGSSTTIATDTIWDAAGDLVQGTGADTAAKLSAGATAGMYLRSGGAAAANLWSTLILPNAGTAYTLPVYSATNVMTELAAPGTTGQVLTAAT